MQGFSCTPSSYALSTYAEGEIDLIAVYCGELDRCYLLSGRELVDRRAIYLRVTPPRNRQRACLNLASDVEFAGAVAQLGERRSGTPKATGSSPVSSIPSHDTAVRVIGAHEFRNHFGYHVERAGAGEEILVTRRGRPYVRLVAAEPRLPMAA